MREHKFRGKGLGTKKWRYGSFVVLNDGDDVECQIVSPDDGKIETVDCDSVGQYTGLHDKNGKEIYEGDIVENPGNKEKYKVAFKDDAFVVMFPTGRYYYLYDENIFIEIIGNIFENPELFDHIPGVGNKEVSDV